MTKTTSSLQETIVKALDTSYPLSLRNDIILALATNDLNRISTLIANTSETTLDLSHTYLPINDAALGAIALGLKNNKTLTNLNLGGNFITDEGALALACALNSNKKLITINLCANNISNEGKKVFEKFKSVTVNLTYNDPLSYNEPPSKTSSTAISTPPAKLSFPKMHSFLGALKLNSPDQKQSPTQEITPKEKSPIRKLLSPLAQSLETKIKKAATKSDFGLIKKLISETTDEELTVDFTFNDSQKNDLIFIAIINGLRTNESLNSLAFSGPLSELVIEPTIDTLKINKNITHLDLGKNDFPLTAIEEIRDLIEGEPKNLESDLAKELPEFKFFAPKLQQLNLTISHNPISTDYDDSIDSKLKTDEQIETVFHFCNSGKTSPSSSPKSSTTARLLPPEMEKEIG